MPKLRVGTPGWAQSSLDQSHGTLNFQEHLKDPEQDKARHQEIHGYGRAESC